MWKYGNYKMSRILLFGSTGFLGKAILDKFLKTEHEVFAMNRSIDVHIESNSFCADILEPMSYRRKLKQLDPQIVISTPWTTTGGFWHSKQNYDYMRATIELAEIALSGNVERFIGLGSSAEFGNTFLAPTSMHESINPSTEYGKSKAEASRAISKIAKSYGKDFNWLRIFQAYGRHERESRLIPYVIRSLSLGEKVILQNAPMVLDWIHTEDIADAVGYLLETKVSEHFLDVGTSNGTSVLEVVSKLAQLLGASEELIEVQSPSQISHLVCSTESALFRAGWKPKLSLDQGLSKVVGL